MHQSYSVCRGKKELNSTWHAHFYSKPPETPTPHFIEDILGLRSQATRQDGKEMREKFAVHKQNDQEISGTLLEDMHCTRKSKQSSKYKPRRTVGNHKDALGSRPKAVSSPKRRRDEQTIVTKVKESQQSKHITQAEIKKKKKARTTFTGRQIWELENTFKEKKYLTSAERNDLAELLNVTDCQVKIWFQNRRTKHKKLEVATTNTEPSPNKKDQQSSGGLDCSPTSEEILSSDEKTNNFSKHDSDDDMADVCEGND